MLGRGEESMEILDSIPEEEEDPVIDTGDDSDGEESEAETEIADGDPNLPYESGFDATEVMINWASYEDNVYQDANTYNLLLIGVDSRENDMRGRSDSMIVVSVNRKTKTITLTSLMRDSFVYIPEVGYNRLNAAAAYGGAPLLIRTIEMNFNIHIDNYLITNFEVFTETVNTMGGVDMEISSAEAQYINQRICGASVYPGNDTGATSDAEAIAAGYLPASGGYVHMNGAQTLQYCRCRYIGNADYERTERQRKTLLVLAEKAKKLSLSEINSIATTLLPKMSTNLSQGDCLSLLFNAVTSYKNYDIQTLRLPADGTMTGVYVWGMAVLSLDFEKNIDLFFSEVYNR
jgi:LCP family protein required for cell wall assembly